MSRLTIEENDFQRNTEWHQVRLGRFTASEFSRLMSEPKSKADKEAGKLSQGAMTYVMEKVSEYLTNKPAKDEFDSKYTQWGEEYEPLAKSIYEAVFDRKVTLSGFIELEDAFGGSPDGLVNEDGVLEIKCPYTITSHLGHLLMTTPSDLKAEKPDYYWQCLGYLLITDREWCDFISYHPHFPAKLQLKRITINRDSELIRNDLDRLDEKLTAAEKEFNNILTLIKS